MMILTVPLIIALAVSVNSTGSPKRLLNQVHKPIGSASTSGRNFEESTDTKTHYDSKGLFYEENGKYYPVRRGIPLIEQQGSIIGRYNNGLLAPVFNSERKLVSAYASDYHFQFELDEEEFLEAQKEFQIGQPMPRDSRIVNLLVPQEPDVKVRPHDHEVNSSSAPSKKLKKSDE